MAEYLPFGKEMIATDKQMMDRKNMFLRYDMYDIPYGLLDNPSGEEQRTQVDTDKAKAKMLIMQGKTLPKDLEQRLLTYKNDKQKSKVKQ